MSVVENKAMIRQYVAELSNTDGGAIVSKYFDPQCIVHNPAAPGTLHGIEATQGYVAALKQAFPDIHLTVDDIFGESDKICLRATVSGTLDGTFAGIPPTHKHASWTLNAIYQIKDGRIKELWEELDLLGGFRRLGVLPPLA